MSVPVIIEEIKNGSPAEKAGLKKGDNLISINGSRIKDIIDLIYYGADSSLNILIKRENKNLKFNIERKEGEELGIKTGSFSIKRCRNKCVFCFVSQLPKGLRKTLYIKDDDYRLSFLYGNFITLTNLKEEDILRIKKQHLSPLYISVHHTQKKKRNMMLGNPDAPDILKQLRLLADARIKMHCQIVLCPGYNDGEDLKKTLRDLIKFHPYVLSIAVVPVGITRFNRSNIKPVEREDAIKALDIIESMDKTFKKRHGKHFIHGADELYLKAERPLPGIKRYEGFPQIENGVGMITYFIHSTKKIKIPRISTRKRIVTFTGESFYPYLLPFVERLKNDTKLQIELVKIKNRFFGETVTVTGLITGRDIIEHLADKVDHKDYLLIPDVTLRDGGNEFLDGLSIEDIKKTLSVNTLKIESSPEGLINTLEVLK